MLNTGDPPALDLSTPAGRRAGFDLLRRGIPMVNRLLGTDIPMPTLRRWHPSALADDACRDSGRYHQVLLGGLLDAPPGPGSDWEALLPAVGAMMPDRFRLTRDADELAALTERPDERVIERAGRMFSFTAADLPDAIDAHDMIYAKINHGFWEDVAVMALGAAGIQYVRPHSVWERYRVSRFSHVVAQALDLSHRSHIADGREPGSLSVNRAWFGISYTNGEVRAAEDLVLPLHPVARGAMIGMELLFGELPGAERWHVSEGSLGKELFWDRRLDEVIVRLSEVSDVMLFIVPPHLDGIRVERWPGRTEHLVIPARLVHPLWPSVLSTILGTVDLLLSVHRSVTIVAQAAVMAGLAGVVLRLHRRDDPRGTVRYLDLGQVLDVAVPDDPRVGSWLTRLGDPPRSVLHRPDPPR